MFFLCFYSTLMITGKYSCNYFPLLFLGTIIYSLFFWQCKEVARPGVKDYEISIYLTWCHVGLFYFQILFALMHAVLLPKLRTNYYYFSKKESTVTRFQLTVWVLSIIFVLLPLFFLHSHLSLLHTCHLLLCTLPTFSSCLKIYLWQRHLEQKWMFRLSSEKTGPQRLYWFL